MSILMFTGENQKLRNLIAYALDKEAGGESLEGIEAVATVILNRAKKIENIESILLKPFQFSCFNNVTEQTLTNLKNQITLSSLIPIQVADKIIENKFSPMDNWNHYYNPKKLTHPPRWTALLTNKKQIGNHLFGYIE